MLIGKIRNKLELFLDIKTLVYLIFANDANRLLEMA